MSDDQIIVLDWMKRISKMLKLEQVLYHLNVTDKIAEEIGEAYSRLNIYEKYQVLQAFAEWGMEQSKSQNGVIKEVRKGR
ncbi:hypothetical protein P7D93_18705 [Enterococcus raffinosus]|uniref:hypothetical protein n=1 Tax=Enterococcus raffinosus TaxID=71452 RepID=UPI002891E051|nr:hypothetical protein [Enterococcus raffinosus]MDT2531893.1 hypothetical protein [Enterococcus raffinosus]